MPSLDLKGKLKGEESVIEGHVFPRVIAQAHAGM